MYKAYFTRRLLEALCLADEATNAHERSIHLRTSRYYCALLGLDSLPPRTSNRNREVAEARRRG